MQPEHVPRFCAIAQPSAAHRKGRPKSRYCRLVPLLHPAVAGFDPKVLIQLAQAKLNVVELQWHEVGWQKTVTHSERI
jgi:hypothetical protein